MFGLFRRREVIACAGISWHDAGRSQTTLEDAVALHRVRRGVLEDGGEIGFEAEFCNGRLHAVLEADAEARSAEGRQPLIPVRGAIPDLEVASGPVRGIIALGESESGSSRLGGAFSDLRVEGFPYALTPFAELSRSDAAFAWLPFDIRLAFPFTAELHEPPIFFDYSDPSQPTVLEGDWFTTGDFGYGLGPDDRLVLEERSLGAVEPGQRGAGLTRAGVPSWEQAPEPPLSPTTGERMSFVAQIQSASLPLVAGMESGATLPSRLADRRRVGFWSDGTLYVFIEAETRLVAFVLQTS